MSVLVYIDHSEGTIKKNSLEAATYAAAVGKILGTDAFGLILGNTTSDLSALGKFDIIKRFSTPSGTVTLSRKNPFEITFSDINFDQSIAEIETAIESLEELHSSM